MQLVFTLLSLKILPVHCLVNVHNYFISEKEREVVATKNAEISELLGMKHVIISSFKHYYLKNGSH